MSFDVKGKVALVTGANRGIGRAIVDALIAAGASKVYLGVRNLASVEPIQAQYKEKVVPVFVDVSQESTVQEMAQQVEDVQLVVNNAGVLALANPLSDNAEEALQSELNVNVFGFLHVAKALIPVLEKNNGAFAQLNSVASIKSFTDLATYSASKAAAYSLTQALRDVVKDKGIHILSVHPGPIATDMADQGGMRDIAEPPSVVAEGIVQALKEGKFHLFPDTLAKQFESAYLSYATDVVEAVAE